MRRRAIALLLACGCSAPEQLWLDFPPSEDAKALVLAAELDGVIAYAQAYALEPRPTVLGFGVALTDEARIHGLVYARSLEELGIAPGPLESIPAPEGRPLPAADAIYQTALADDFTTWSLEGESSTLDRFTARYEPPPLPPCTELVARVSTLTSTSEWQFSVAIDDGSVLLGTKADELFVITATSIEPIIDRPPGFVPDTATRDPAGGLLFGARNAIWKGRVVPPASIVAQPFLLATGAGRFDTIGGRSDPTEIFGVTRDSRFISIDVSGVSVLHDFSPDTNDFGIASSAPGDVVAVGDAPSAVHYRDGDIEQEVTPYPIDALIAVAHSSELGYVAGTRTGKVLRRADDWESLGDTGVSLAIRTITPYPRGFLFGGANGSVGQYVEGRGFCEPTYPVPGVIYALHLMGERVVVLQKIISYGIAILEPLPSE